jgi:iron complex outermembrane receptor protein
MNNFNIKLHLSSFILFTCFVSINISLAQNSVIVQNDSLKIKKDTAIFHNLEEVSISSIRADRNFPVTETTIKQSELERNYTGQEMPVILAQTPSVTWYSDGGNYTGYSYLRLRGLDQTRVNYTLNGVPLNEPEDQGAYFSNYPDFLNSVHSIQVQRGVGLSTNGSASFAGSVNTESPSLNDSAYTELNTSYGSYHAYRVSPEFNTGLLKNNWSFYGRYSSVGSDGFREHSGTNGSSFFFSGGYMGKKSTLKFTSFTGLSKNEMAYEAVPDSILKKDYRANLLTPNEKDEFKQSLAMLQYIVPTGKNGYVSATAYYNYLEGGYTILFTPDLYNYSVKSNFYGGIINYQYNKNALKANIGLHANEYARSHFSSIEPNENNLLYQNTGHKNEFATFLKLSYAIKKITLFTDLQYRYASFRYDADKNMPLSIQPVSWQFVNPKAGISYLFQNKHILYASIGKTSREPTRNDMLAGYDNIDSLNYIEIGKLNRVKPESVTDAELGVKLSFQKMKLELNIYDMEFKNEIAAIGQLSYIGLPLRKNVPSSYRRGLEVNFVTTPFSGLSLSTQANFSSNRIKVYTSDYDTSTYFNTKPLLTPQVIINQTASYSFAKWFRAEVSGRYISQSYLDNSDNENFIIPSSFIINAAIGINPFKKISINFMVNNIMNRKYYTAGYVQNAQPYYFAMATRNYFVTLKLRF